MFEKTCPLCGIPIVELKYSSKRMVQDGTEAFFCNDRHAEIFLQQAS